MLIDFLLVYLLIACIAVWVAIAGHYHHDGDGTTKRQ
jgi:hypothetical protein